MDADDYDVYEEEDVDELAEYRKAQKLIETRAAVSEEAELIRQRFGGSNQSGKKTTDEFRGEGTDAHGEPSEEDADFEAQMQESIEVYVAQFVDKLGYMPDGAHASMAYRINENCKSMLRNLLRISQKETYPFPVRAFLSKAKVMHRDLVHIAVQTAAASPDDEDKRDIFNYNLRLMLYLATPVDDRLAKLDERDSGEVEAVRLETQTQFAQIKEVLADEAFYGALRSKLELLLRKPKDDWEDDEDMNFTRLLKLITYILRMPSCVPNTTSSVIVSSLSSHDLIIMAMHKARLTAIIMFLATNKDFQDAAMDALEILYFMLLPYDPELVGHSCKPGTELPTQPASSTGTAFKPKSTPSSADQIFANVLNEQRVAHDLVQKRAQQFSRYQGCVEVRNLKALDAERNVLTNRPIADILANNVDATFATAASRKPQRRGLKEAHPAAAASMVTITADSRVLWTVKIICEQILKSSFNKVIARAHDLLVASILPDERHAMFMWSLHYFVKYNVAACRKSSSSSTPLRIELISQAVDKNMFQQVQVYILACFERITSTDRMRADVWLARAHTAIKAFRDLLYALLALQQRQDDKDIVAAAKALENHIFYVPEYRDLCLFMLHAVDPQRLPLSLLQDVVETVHIFLRLLEGYIWAERGYFVAVDMRRRRRKAKKGGQKRQKTTDGDGDVEPTKNDNDVAQFIAGKNDADDDDDDDSDENDDTREAEFNFVQFLRKFATLSSLRPYFIVLSRYRENTLLVNHAVVKMFHRVVFEVKLPAVLYKATLFFTFQKILNDPFLDMPTPNDNGNNEESASSKLKVESAMQLKEIVRVILGHFFVNVSAKKILALVIPLELGAADRLENVTAAKKRQSRPKIYSKTASVTADLL